MESNEQIVKMSPLDVQVLEKYKQGSSWHGIGCLIWSAIGFLVLFVLLRAREEWQSYRPVFFIAMPLVVCAILYRRRVSNKKKQSSNQLVDLDLKDGNKKIITRHIQKQNISSFTRRSAWNNNYYDREVIICYEMMIDWKLYSSSKELFEKTKDGDIIYFHTTLDSDFILYYTIDGDQTLYPSSNLQRK